MCKVTFYPVLKTVLLSFMITFLSPQTSKIIAAAQGDFTPYSADGAAAAAAAAAVAKSGGAKNNVIRAVIDKLLYNITVDVLYKVYLNILNFLERNVSVQVFLTVPCIFCVLLVGRICLNIKGQTFYLL